MKLNLLMPLICMGMATLAGCSDLFDRAEQTLIDTAEAQIRGQLLDPDETKFQNVRGSPQLGCVTGQLMGKNSFGAYTGWQEFYWHENSGAILAENDASAVTTATLRCAVGLDLKDFLDMPTSADQRLAEQMKPVILEQIKDPKAALYNVAASASQNCVSGKYLLPGQPIKFFAWKDGVSDFSDVKDEVAMKKYSECMKAMSDGFSSN
jgi:hypothetical protein